MSDLNKRLEKYKGKRNHIDYDWEIIEPLMESIKYSDKNWSQKMKKFDNYLFTTLEERMQYELEKQSDLDISTFNDDVSSQLAPLGNSVNSQRKELSTKKNTRVNRLHKRKRDFFTQMYPEYKAIKEMEKRERERKEIENEERERKENEILREERDSLAEEIRKLQTETDHYKKRCNEFQFETETIYGQDMQGVSSLPHFAEQNFNDQDVQQPQQAGLPLRLSQALDYLNSSNYSFPHMGMN